MTGLDADSDFLEKTVLSKNAGVTPEPTRFG